MTLGDMEAVEDGDFPGTEGPPEKTKKEMRMEKLRDLLNWAEKWKVLRIKKMVELKMMTHWISLVKEMMP